MQFSLKLRAVNKENSKMLGHYIIMSGRPIQNHELKLVMNTSLNGCFHYIVILIRKWLIILEPTSATFLLERPRETVIF